MTPNTTQRHPFRRDRYSPRPTIFSQKLVSQIATLLLLSAVILLGTERSTLATLGNLGIPTASERFLEAGRRNLEREIQNLQRPDAPSAEVLRVKEVPQDRLDLEDPRLRLPAQRPDRQSRNVR